MRQFVFCLALVPSLIQASSTFMLHKEIEQHNAVSTHYASRSLAELHLKPIQKRTTNVPTQIVRLDVDLTNYRLTCDEIQHAANVILTEELEKEDFTFMIAGFCYKYEQEDSLATAKHYTLSAFFDPRTDKAITYLQQYLTKYNETDFFGVPFRIESAKGLVVSLGIETGVREVSYSVSANISNKLFFNNAYEIDETLVSDIENKLHSNQPEQISNFINQWIRKYNVLDYYLEALSDSNYVQTTIDFMFLMDKEPKAYATPFYRSFSHIYQKT